MIFLTQKPGELIISGLSTDIKPTSVPENSIFIERDTLIQSTFTNSIWIPQVTPILSQRKVSDQSVTNSTVLVDDVDLKFTMLSNASYRFDILLFVTSASATPDFKFAITSVQAPQDIRYQVEIWQASVGLTLDHHSIETAYNSVISANWGAAPDTYCRLQGYVTNGNSLAEFKVQWAQRVANATPTIVKQGSSMNIMRTIN